MVPQYALLKNGVPFKTNFGEEPDVETLIRLTRIASRLFPHIAWAIVEIVESNEIGQDTYIIIASAKNGWLYRNARLAFV